MQTTDIDTYTEPTADDIIRQRYSDVTVSVSEIASSIGLSTETVRKRAQRMKVHRDKAAAAMLHNRRMRDAPDFPKTDRQAGEARLAAAVDAGGGFEDMPGLQGR